MPQREVAFIYYDGPVPRSIEPHFGPVKNPNNATAIIYGTNFVCAPGDYNCDNLVVRLGTEEK